MGEGNSNFKHGKYSRLLADSIPEGMKNRFESIKANPALALLDDTLAILMIELQDELLIYHNEEAVGIDPADIRNSWNEVQAAAAALNKSDTRDNRMRSEVALNAHADTVKGIYARERKWVKITDLIERHRRTADSKRRADKAVGRMIAVEEVNLMFATILHIILSRVPDQTTRNTITDDIRRVVYGSVPAIA